MRNPPPPPWFDNGLSACFCSACFFRHDGRNGLMSGTMLHNHNPTIPYSTAPRHATLHHTTPWPNQTTTPTHTSHHTPHHTIPHTTMATHTHGLTTPHGLTRRDGSYPHSHKPLRLGAQAVWAIANLAVNEEVKELLGGLDAVPVLLDALGSAVKSNEVCRTS